MNLVTLEKRPGSLIIRRQLKPYLIDLVSVMSWLIGAACLLGITICLDERSSEWQAPAILWGAFWIVFGGPSLVRAMIGIFIKSSDYVLDTVNGVIYSGNVPIGDITQATSVKLEAAVPSGFKVQYRVVVELDDGRKIALAYTPREPCVFDMASTYSDQRKLLGVKRPKWTTSQEFMSATDYGYADMANLVVAIDKEMAIVDGYEAHVNAVR